MNVTQVHFNNTMRKKLHWWYVLANMLHCKETNEQTKEKKMKFKEKTIT